MLQLLILVGRALALGRRGHRDAGPGEPGAPAAADAMQRTNARSRLLPRDRLFCIALAMHLEELAHGADIRSS